jgi:nicotinate-nucleotide adenylyltransferase
MTKKVGLFFGSFNPIHIGHLVVANTVMNEDLVDELWFMVSPKNPSKMDRDDMAPYWHRYNMVKIASWTLSNTESDKMMKACDYELNLPIPSFTSATLAKLREDYPENEFSIICGSDVQCDIGNWKDYEDIVKNHSFIVYERDEADLNGLLLSVSEKSTYLSAPMLGVSSTYVRGLIKENKSLKYILPDEVIDYIYSNGLYNAKK